MWDRLAGADGTSKRTDRHGGRLGDQRTLMMAMVKATMTKKKKKNNNNNNNKYGKEKKKRQRGDARVGVQRWLVTGKSGLEAEITAGEWVVVVKEGSAPGGEQKRAARRRRTRRQITSDGEQRRADSRAAKKGGGDVRAGGLGGGGDKEAGPWAAGAQRRACKMSEGKYGGGQGPRGPRVFRLVGRGPEAAACPAWDSVKVDRGTRLCSCEAVLSAMV